MASERKWNASLPVQDSRRIENALKSKATASVFEENQC
jgi:hypothetical protein